METSCSSEAVDIALFLEDRFPSVETKIQVLTTEIVFDSQVLQPSFQVMLLCQRSSFPSFERFRLAASMVPDFLLWVEIALQLSMSQSELAILQLSMAFRIIL